MKDRLRVFFADTSSPESTKSPAREPLPGLV
jgi:hypothetical protein